MTLVKRNSVLPRLFDDFVMKDFFDWGVNNYSASGSSLPRTNIIETNDGFEVELAVPGMEKKDFIIELDNETLKISSEKEVANDREKEGKVVRREFSYESFQRVFHLPKTVVDDSKIEAKYQSGILRILIPKREEAKPTPPRSISIK